MSAICITLGEQSENHAGMKMYGNGLAERGYSVLELEKIKKCIEEKGGCCELIRLDEFKINSDNEVEPAGVLILRGGVNWMIENYYGGVANSNFIFDELLKLEWDSKYWDTRRGKVLNKIARWNLCFGDEDDDPDYEQKKGRVVRLKNSMLNCWKIGVENFMEDIVGKFEKFECEGNYYYDVKKCGIGFHGDGERKKIVAGSFGSSRKIVWCWYERSKRVSDKIEIDLKGGDMYFMSEKASGWDWKKKSKITLRHAAGGDKYIK